MKESVNYDKPTIEFPTDGVTLLPGYHLQRSHEEETGNRYREVRSRNRTDIEKLRGKTGYGYREACGKIGNRYRKVTWRYRK